MDYRYEIFGRNGIDQGILHAKTLISAQRKVTAELRKIYRATYTWSKWSDPQENATVRVCKDGHRCTVGWIKVFDATEGSKETADRILGNIKNGRAL